MSSNGEFRQERGGGEAPRVLIVEDHPLVSDTLAFTLTHEGMTVVSASGDSVAATIDNARTARADVAVVDLALGSDPRRGICLVRPLVALGTRVVIFTGSTDEVLLGGCLWEGAWGIVSKSVSVDEVIAQVRNAVNGLPVMKPARHAELLAAARSSRTERLARLKPFERLTAREQQVFLGLMDGLTAKEIAAAVPVSLPTVRTQIQSILSKLGVASQLQAVAMARRAGWPDTPLPLRRPSETHSD